MRGFTTIHVALLVLRAGERKSGVVFNHEAHASARIPRARTAHGASRDGLQMRRRERRDHVQDRPCRAGTKEQQIRLQEFAPPPEPPQRPRNPITHTTRPTSRRPAAAAAHRSADVLSLHTLRRLALHERSGQPGSALVPLGVLGIPGRSLAEAYGGPTASAYPRRDCARFRTCRPGTLRSAHEHVDRRRMSRRGARGSVYVSAPIARRRRLEIASRVQRHARRSCNSSRRICSSVCAVADARWAEAHPISRAIGWASAHRFYGDRTIFMGPYDQLNSSSGAGA